MIYIYIHTDIHIHIYIYTYTYLHIHVKKKERKKKNYERLSILKSPCSPYSQLGGQDINMLLHFPNIL